MVLSKYLHASNLSLTQNVGANVIEEISLLNQYFARHANFVFLEKVLGIN